MLKIDGNNTIHITRGDFAQITVNFSAPLTDDQNIILKVCPVNDVTHPIFITETVTPHSGDTAVTIYIYPNDTKETVPTSNIPLTYWYEIELGPNAPWSSTLVGYDAAGPKLFIVYPEGIHS